MNSSFNHEEMVQTPRIILQSKNGSSNSSFSDNPAGNCHAV